MFLLGAMLEAIEVSFLIKMNKIIISESTCKEHSSRKITGIFILEWESIIIAVIGYCNIGTLFLFYQHKDACCFFVFF